MSSPHLRRRYRAAGSRPGLVYLFLLLACATLYVGLRVYTIREQRVVEALRREIGELETTCDRLVARRDSLQSLAAIGPRAGALGLAPPALDQLARLPLEAPALYEEPLAAEPVTLGDAAGRVWQWLDLPGVQTTEAHAGE